MIESGKWINRQLRRMRPSLEQLPQRVAAEEVTTATPHLRVRDEGAERELGMVWDPERSETPVVRGFREFVTRSGRKLCKMAMVQKPA